MALLSMCLDAKYDLVVAHVNYHRRESADRDENIVKDYCLTNKIPFHLLEPVQESKGNFQDWARKVRFSFFRELYHSYQAEGLLLAHHQDDLLETYLIQLERNAKVDYYGIAEETTIDEMKVYRLLLSYTKQELLEYVENNSVTYGFDESNLSDVYLRNRIRHQQIDNMPLTRRMELLAEICERNLNLANYQQKLNDVVASLMVNWSKREFIKLDEELRKDALRLYLSEHNVDVSSYSDSYMGHLVKCCLSSKCCREQLNEDTILDQCYGEVKIHMRNKPYQYELSDKIEMETPFFRVSTNIGTSVEAVYVETSDFPLTIRSPIPDDAIVLRFGTKKVSRWFIDRKIPLWERDLWPIVINARGEVILVPKIGCNVEHYNVKPNLFVIKCS
jgi:tRNA(Ile)-lysidine synthetase, N-terminal domain/tRNA(Ile)-lysidine synthetase, C-terminal domain